MTDRLEQEIYANLRLKDTDELLEIWEGNDRVDWSEEAFGAVHRILVERGIALPPQGPPIIEHDDRAGENQEESDDGPVFYNPDEVVRLSDWLGAGAWVLVFMTVVGNLFVVSPLPDMVRYYLGLARGQDIPVGILSLILAIAFMGLSCIVSFALMKALASGLMILMEMEENSRAPFAPRPAAGSIAADAGGRAS